MIPVYISKSYTKKQSALASEEDYKMGGHKPRQ